MMRVLSSVKENSHICTSSLCFWIGSLLLPPAFSIVSHFRWLFCLGEAVCFSQSCRTIRHLFQTAPPPSRLFAARFPIPVVCKAWRIISPRSRSFQSRHAIVMRRFIFWHYCNRAAIKLKVQMWHLWMSTLIIWLQTEEVRNVALYICQMKRLTLWQDIVCSCKGVFSPFCWTLRCREYVEHGLSL